MKSLVIFLMVFPPVFALANAVRWGGAALTNGEVYCTKPIDDNYIVPGAEIIYSTPHEDPYVWEFPIYYVNGSFSVAADGGSTIIKGVGHALSGSDVFVRMDAGEIVSALTTFYNDEVFYRYGYRPGDDDNDHSNFRDYGDYVIEIPSDGSKTFFLGFGTDGATETEALWLYGWLEIAVNGTELSIVNSAIGLDGQDMKVGAIPEPSSVVLFIIGFVPIALLRPRDGGKRKAARLACRGTPQGSRHNMETAQENAL